MRPAEPSPSAASQPRYRGVRKRTWGRWVSEIRLPNSRARIWLGSYDSAEKAARAFDAATYCLRGTRGRFNFPSDVPEIPGRRSLSPQEVRAVAMRFANGRTAPVAGVSLSDEMSSDDGDSGIDWSFADGLQPLPASGGSGFIGGFPMIDVVYAGAVSPWMDGFEMDQGGGDWMVDWMHSSAWYF